MIAATGRMRQEFEGETADYQIMAWRDRNGKMLTAWSIEFPRGGDDVFMMPITEVELEERGPYWVTLVAEMRKSVERHLNWLEREGAI